ncbi:MAG: REP-associated tyrosine transposase [Verrucomicrobiae bacterium]|nr:REP-associated tyrosine transposase [Verrucomicrobiae bacterium]
MPNYRRWFVPGATYFFTLVTENRVPLFAGEIARANLRTAIAECRQRWPFELNAIVLLPEHLHMLWTLPGGDVDFPRRIAWIKRAFTQDWLLAGGAEQPMTDSRQHRRRRGVWQRSFWEHTIRDDTDFGRHLDYIHYNPVKHGLVTCPHQWSFSSFQQWIERGVYAIEWGCACGARKPAAITFADLDKTAME